MQGTLRGAIPSCILHAALHCCLSMLMLQMMMPHRCYYVLMACIDVTMHLMACSTASTTPHCLACCMCMHRLPMCISGRERWGWALELRSEVTLKFCTYESCSISKYTVVWGPRWYHFFVKICLGRKRNPRHVHKMQISSSSHSHKYLTYMGRLISKS